MCNKHKVEVFETSPNWYASHKMNEIYTQERDRSEKIYDFTIILTDLYGREILKYIDVLLIIETLGALAFPVPVNNIK